MTYRVDRKTHELVAKLTEALGMNYYAPKQRVESGRWDYTRTSGDFTFADGYCMGHSRIPESTTSKKYHNDGHATPEEACLCFKQYELDHFLVFKEHPCVTEKVGCRFPGCNELTHRYATITITDAHWGLCEKHLNRASVDLIYSVGERFSLF